MRIELMSTGASSISSMQNRLQNLHNNINATIQSLQNARQRINTLPGGAQNLSVAANNLQHRIGREQSKMDSVERLSQRVNTFISNTVQIDMQVAQQVTQNQSAFFSENPWAGVSVATKKSRWSRIFEGLKKDFTDWIKKTWNGIVEFVKDHAVDILIGTIFIAVGALITVLTGGAALTLAGFLSAFLVGLKAAAVSAAISAGISTAMALFTGENVLYAFFDGAVGGYKWGGIMAGFTQTIAGLLRISTKLGITRAGVFNFGKLKIWSPNSVTNTNSGGTLFGIGKTFRIDFEAGKQLFHTHISHSLYNKLPDIIKRMKIFDPARRDVHVRLTVIVAQIFERLNQRKRGAGK